MPRVVLAEAALEDLESLISSHSLPPDTRERVKRSLRPLQDFPYLGAPLSGRWEGFRFLLGPWRWMLIVYEDLEDEQTVVIVTIQDGRSSRGVTASR
jgi:plasmid stabilization system protein ParE